MSFESYVRCLIFSNKPSGGRIFEFLISAFVGFLSFVDGEARKAATINPVSDYGNLTIALEIIMLRNLFFYCIKQLKYHLGKIAG